MLSISVYRIFLVFLRLGLTSFGGPVAHLGYFHNTLIRRLRWLDEDSFAELIALCQFLPGPSSSQVSIGIGLAKGGWPGAIAAWAGFTLPSAFAMTMLGIGMGYFGAGIPGWLSHGLILVAVPVVAQAILLMTRQLCPDWPRRFLALVSTVILLWLPLPAIQPLTIAAGGVLGWFFLNGPSNNLPKAFPTGLNRRTAFAALGLFFLLLALLPFVSGILHNHALAVFSAFYQSGALVFGGGHVVLPLLQSAVIPTGWVSGADFLAGYGAAQAMPGPLFSFAAYLGAVMTSAPNNLAGAAMCLAAIYLPSFLLVIGALPIWEAVRHHPQVRGALSGVNAVVVGLLLAAFCRPVWTSAVHTPTDLVLALAGFGLLTVVSMPSWAVVILTVVGAGLLAAV